MQKATFLDARLLIVDDQPANVLYLQRLLERMGYTHVTGITDSRDVLAHYAADPPDLILLDLMMPFVDGFEIMEQLAEVIPVKSYLPILVLTADMSIETKRRALALGAKDFLTKPFDQDEVLLRIQNLLETHYLHRSLQRQNKRLEQKVRARSRTLVAAQVETLERLASAVEYRDDTSGQHIYRVGETCAQVARVLGFSASYCALIARAALLHDLGKIGIPDSILLKPGKLTAEEIAVMQSHTTIGGAVLAGGRTLLMSMARQIALTHHERWDGSGYPRGLAGEAIPHAGRIVAVVDVFDALTHDRPYKPAWSEAAAVAEIQAQSGRQFDPEVVTAFITLLGDTDRQRQLIAQAARYDMVYA
jgi:putative two-component system response regulator